MRRAVDAQIQVALVRDLETLGVKLHRARQGVGRSAAMLPIRLERAGRDAQRLFVLLKLAAQALQPRQRLFAMPGAAQTERIKLIETKILWHARQRALKDALSIAGVAV